MLALEKWPRNWGYLDPLDWQHSEFGVLKTDMPMTKEEIPSSNEDDVESTQDSTHTKLLSSGSSSKNVSYLPAD